MPRGGIEPPTRGFSIHCSTPELPGHGKAYRLGWGRSMPSTRPCPETFDKKITNVWFADFPQLVPVHFQDLQRPGWVQRMHQSTISPSRHQRTAYCRTAGKLHWFHPRKLGKSSQHLFQNTRQSHPATLTLKFVVTKRRPPHQHCLLCIGTEGGPQSRFKGTSILFGHRC